ncbi:MAG: hypothetical protein WCK93_10955 [Nitrosomonadales bacterium]
MKIIFGLIAAVLSFQVTATECEKKEVLRPSINKKYSVAVDDLTANPSALLTETSKSVLKMAKTGQVYIVQVSVKPL